MSDIIEITDSDKLADLCEWLGVTLAEAVIAEINRNEKRGYMHGNKAA